MPWIPLNSHVGSFCDVGEWFGCLKLGFFVNGGRIFQTAYVGWILEFDISSLFNSFGFSDGIENIQTLCRLIVGLSIQLGVRETIENVGFENLTYIFYRVPYSEAT